MTRPRKVCRWFYDIDHDHWTTNCKMVTAKEPKKDCPFCGRRIRVEGRKDAEKRNG